MNLEPSACAGGGTAGPSQCPGRRPDVRDPVVDVCAAVEAGLDEFNGAAEGARADEDGQQTNAARAGQREGERGEGDEVDELVAALRRGGGCLQGPEHRELRVSVTMMVRGMSRYLRMQPAYTALGL